MPGSSGRTDDAVLTVLVTGANGRIGAEIVRQIAEVRDAKDGTFRFRVLCCVRDERRGNALVKDVTTSTGNPLVFLYMADISQRSGCLALVNTLKRDKQRIHVLVNNAAVTRPKREYNSDGIELMWATNVLSYWWLSLLCVSENIFFPAIWEQCGPARLTSSRVLSAFAMRSSPNSSAQLQKQTPTDTSPPPGGAPVDSLSLEDHSEKLLAFPRIVNVASFYAGSLDVSNPEFYPPRQFDVDEAYRQSKQANRMLSRVLAKRFEKRVLVNAVHPGVCTSNVSLGLGYDLDRSDEAAKKCARGPAFLATDISSKVLGVTGRYWNGRTPGKCDFSEGGDDVQRALQALVQVVESYNS